MIHGQHFCGLYVLSSIVMSLCTYRFSEANNGVGYPNGCCETSWIETECFMLVRDTDVMSGGAEDQGDLL